MTITRLTLPAVREDRGRFAAMRGKRVLIYWPHGFGDWVTFGVIAPLLEPSNEYAITRFGDDYVTVAEGMTGVEPLSSGIRVPDDGSALGTPHFGLRLAQCNGRKVELEIPPPLDLGIHRFAPDCLLWTDYPETEGRTPYPFHTKARNAAGLLVPAERLAGLDLSMPLRSAHDFTAPASVQRAVDERLAPLIEPSARLGVISRSGKTAARKNWGTGSEAREFVAAMRRHSNAWRFVSMDDEDLGEGVAGFRELFGDVDEPFGRIYKALTRRIDLFVGIPAGPLHFTLARGGIPTVGLWVAHHPDWYDEPNPDAVHLVGEYVRARRFERRPATMTKPSSLQHRLRYLDAYAIDAQSVVDAALSVT